MRRFRCAALIGSMAAVGLALFAARSDAQTRAVPETRAEVQLSFAPVVKRVAPAVVNVYASRQVRAQGGGLSPMFDDPVFRHFFGDNPFGMPRDRMESSLGSGVIIDPSGLIVTNHHVIKDATEVKVALADKREFEAEIVLKDERTDLAVIRIKDKGTYPFAELGDSDRTEVGDIVLAIGNPFGVGQTVTQGIVSALARTQVGVADFRFFIQTDAAINPGNSGGALVDINGRLIGIPSAIYSRSGGSIGIGFAIPVTMVKFVVQQAKNGGVVRRPWLGATLQAVTPDVAESLGLKRPQGALVTGVVAGGPAATAGLKVGDLVLMVDGFEVDDPDAFGYRFSTKALGGTVRVDIQRGSTVRALDVPLQTAPETVPRDERRIEGFSPFSGLSVVNLSPAVADELHLTTNADGVVVKDVADGSPASRVGFRRGDMILEVNGQKIDQTRTLARVAETDPGIWRLAVQREGQVIRMAFR